MSRLNDYHDALARLDEPALSERLKKLGSRTHGPSILKELATQKVNGQELVTQPGGEVEIVSYKLTKVASSVATAAKRVLREMNTPPVLDVCADAYPAERTYPQAAWEPSF